MPFYNDQRREVSLDCSNSVSMTKQSFKSECDINNILSQYKRTGVISHISARSPQYMELPDEIDYQSAMNTLNAADQAFADLPAVVRRFFDNDPAAFLAALTNPDMKDKLTELGVFNPKPAPTEPGNPDNRVISPAGEPKL